MINALIVGPFGLPSNGYATALEDHLEIFLNSLEPMANIDLQILPTLPESIINDCAEICKNKSYSNRLIMNREKDYDIVINYSPLHMAAPIPGAFNILYLYTELDLIPGGNRESPFYSTNNDWVEPINKVFRLVLTSCTASKDCLIRSGINIPIEIVKWPQYIDNTEKFVEEEIIFKKLSGNEDVEISRLIDIYRIKYLFVGELQPRKNVEQLVKTFSRALHKKNDACLIIKTSSENLNSIEELVNYMQNLLNDDKDLINGSNIYFFMGEISEGNLDYLYKNCAYFISLSKGEGAGGGQYKSMSYGRPLISGLHSSLLDFVSPFNSFIIPSHSDIVTRYTKKHFLPYMKWATYIDDDIISAIKQSYISSNTPIYDVKSNACIKTIETTFDKNRISNEIETIFKQVLPKKFYFDISLIKAYYDSRAFLYKVSGVIKARRSITSNIRISLKSSCDKFLGTTECSVNKNQIKIFKSGQIHQAGSWFERKLPQTVNLIIEDGDNKLLEIPLTFEKKSLDAEIPVNPKTTNIISDFENRHIGETCYIIGNGPSVKFADLERIKDRITMVANRFHRCYDQTSFRPTYTFLEDRLMVANHAYTIASSCESPLFIPVHLSRGMMNPNLVRYVLNPNPKFDKISNNMISGNYFGGSVLFGAIQAAMFMGCKRLIIYGLDHSFTVPKSLESDQRLVVSNNEQNHFIKNYRASSEVWAKPQTEAIERGYYLASKFCKENGIEIINTSRKTKLKAFALGNFDDYI